MTEVTHCSCDIKDNCDRNDDGHGDHVGDNSRTDDKENDGIDEDCRGRIGMEVVIR